MTGRERARGVAALDQLEAVEGAGQRRVEGGGDRRRRARRHHHALVLAAQMEITPDHGEDAGAELAVAGLHADRGAAGVGHHGVAGEPHAVAQRHLAAVERVGLDRVDDVVGPDLAEGEGQEPEEQPARRRHHGEAQKVETGLGAEIGMARKGEIQPVQEIDEVAQADRHQADHDPHDHAAGDQAGLVVAHGAAQGGVAELKRAERVARRRRD